MDGVIPQCAVYPNLLYHREVAPIPAVEAFMATCGEYLVKFGSVVSTSFKAALTRVENCAHNLFDDIYYRTFSTAYINDITNGFNELLSQVTSIQEVNANSQTKPAIIGREKLVAVLTKLTHLDSGNLNGVIKFIKQRREENLSVEEWAFVSSRLDAIQVEWKAALDKKFEDYKTVQLEAEKVRWNVDTLALELASQTRDEDRLREIWIRRDANLAIADEADKEAAIHLSMVRAHEFQSKILSYLALISRLDWAHLAQEEILDVMEKYYFELWDQGYSDSTVYGAYAGVEVGLSLGKEVGLPVFDVTAGISVNCASETELFLDDERCPGRMSFTNVGAKANATVQLPLLAKVGGAVNGTIKSGVYREWDNPRDYAIDQFKTLINEPPHRNNPLIKRYLSRSSTLASDEIKPSYSLLTATRNEVGEIGKLEREYELIKKDIDKQISIFLSSVDRQSVTEEQREKGRYAVEAPEPPKPFQVAPINLAHSEAVDSGIICYTTQAELGAGGGFWKFCSAGVSGSYNRHHYVLPDVKRVGLCERLANPIKARAEKARQNNDIVRQIEMEYERLKESMMDSWIRIGDFDLATQFKFLKQDFEYYTAMHARIALRGTRLAEDEQMLTAFVKRYGAVNSEQFIHRMIMANAYVFSKTNDEELKKQVVEFEKLLLSPKFDIDKNYLLRNAYFQEDLDYEIIDNSVDLTFNVATTFPIGARGSIKLEVRERERKFPNPLRDGYYIDLFFSIKGDIGDITESINAISTQISKKLSIDAANHVTEQLALAWQIGGSTGVYEGELTRQIRFYKPRDYADIVPYSHIFSRWSKMESSTYAIDRVIPSGIVNASFGLSWTTLTTGCLAEDYTGKTLFYFFMQGMREHFLGNIDKKTGEIAAHSYWNTILREQDPGIRTLFENVGREQKRFSRTPFLLDEMAQMKKSIDADKLTEEEEAKAKQLKEKAINDAKNIELLAQKMVEMSRGILIGNHKSKEQLRNKEAAGQIHRLAKDMRLIATEMEMLENCDAKMSQQIELKHKEITAVCKKITANAMSANSAAKAQANEVLKLSTKAYLATKDLSAISTNMLVELDAMSERIEKNVKLTEEDKTNFETKKADFLNVMRMYDAYCNASTEITALLSAVQILEGFLPRFDQSEDAKINVKIEEANALAKKLKTDFDEADQFFVANNMDVYQYCVQCFGELVHAYYPQWAERYYNSDLHLARTLSELETAEVV